MFYSWNLFINQLFPITRYNLLVQTQEKWKNTRETEKKKFMDNIYLQEITQHFGLWHDTRFL